MNITYEVANTIGIAVNNYTDWYDRKICEAIMIMKNKLSEEEYNLKCEEYENKLEKAINFAEGLVNKKEQARIDKAIEYYSASGFVFRNFFETLGEKFSQEKLDELLNLAKE